MRIFFACSVFLAVLSACSTSRQHVPAPVEDRSKKSSSGLTHADKIAEVPAGHYMVRPGDTLIRIGLDQGQNWRDLARWNNLDNPDRIEVGQVLRVQAPPAEAGVTASTQPSGVVVTPVVRTPIIGPSVKSSATNAASTSPATTTAPVVPASASTSTTATASPVTTEQSKPSSSPQSEINFVLPAKGKIIGAYDGVKNKGIDIAGQRGDAVFAAAEGRVVYAGSELRGYGNLVIIKHNNTFLTAYAHNDKLLVKEDQFVKQGQKIAEMGQSESDQVKLHFEIRKMGKPVDPVSYLPAQ